MFKLKKLYSNKDSFHIIEFKNGLNIVIGKSFGSNKQKKKTLNGVGKSLIIKIIDFCLGSDKNNEWTESLKNWIFYLDYEIDDNKYTIERSIDNSGIILLNKQELKLKEFRNELKKQLEIADELTYRECINRYLRKGKKAYVNYYTTIPGEKDCNTLKIIVYLLGLDYKKCENKTILKKNLDENKNLLKKTKNDSDFRTLFVDGGCDIDIELINIEYEINKLNNDLKEYKFSENFNNVKDKADSISLYLDQLNNRKFVIESNINFIKDSLKQDINVTLDSVKQIYDEVKLYWPENLLKKLQDVNNFHTKLLEQRKISLNKDLLLETEKLKDINKLIAQNNSDLNQCLEFLDTHKAMDKYVIIVKQIDKLREKKNSIQQIRTLEKKIKQKIETIKQDLSNSNIETEIYIDSIKEELNSLNTKFITLTKAFYTDKKSALIIKNNDGENQVRFDIDARITSDGSDGIKEIITFCFDWILLLRNQIKQGFLYHDSLLVANVENRQKEILFQIANKLCIDNNKQYIININEDQINGFDEITKKLIKDNTILTLTDKDIKDKLLGIEVDLGSDKK